MGKKLKVGSYLNLIAAVAGIVGVIAMVVSCRIDSAYMLKNMNMLIMMGCAGVFLCLLAVFVPMKLGNHDIVSTASVVGAIYLYMRVLGPMIADRVLMIAGLFSYNSNNMVGWKVFYATVAGAAALIAACLLLIIGAFTKSVEEKEAR